MHDEEMQKNRKRKCGSINTERFWRTRISGRKEKEKSGHHRTSDEKWEKNEKRNAEMRNLGDAASPGGKLAEVGSGRETPRPRHPWTPWRLTSSAASLSKGSFISIIKKHDDIIGQPLGLDNKLHEKHQDSNNLSAWAKASTVSISRWFVGSSMIRQFGRLGGSAFCCSLLKLILTLNFELKKVILWKCPSSVCSPERSKQRATIFFLIKL